MRRRTMLLATAAAVTLGGGWLVLRHAGGGAEAAADPSMIDDRVWVEKRPEKHTDYVHVMLLFTRAHVGIFERASSYDIRLEIAEHQRDGNKVKIVFPQTGAKKDFSFEVTECDALPPFDLCLDLSDNPWGGPRRYYGFTDPDRESRELGELAKKARAAAGE